MPLSFVKNAAAKAAPQDEEQSSPKSTTSNSSTGSSSFNKGSNKSSTAGLNFLKKGEAAKSAFAEAEAQAEIAKAEAGKMFRFFMKEGEERDITFLEGDLDDDGMLDINMFHEHMIKVNGKWENFICTADNEPCPICERGDNRPALVGVTTIIDHTPHKIQNGQNAGKTIVNSRKLFVCKRETIKQLSKLAAKRGGLAGCRFDASRTSDKKPAVGDMFDFKKKYSSFEDIAEEFDLKLEECMPADLAKELTYRTADELVELGVGKATHTIGKEKGVDTKSLKEEL